MPLAVQDGEVSDRKAERSRLQTARAALLHERAIACLSLRERVHGHGLESSSRREPLLGPV